MAIWQICGPLNCNLVDFGKRWIFTIFMQMVISQNQLPFSSLHSNANGIWGIWGTSTKLITSYWTRKWNTLLGLIRNATFCEKHFEKNGMIYIIPSFRILIEIQLTLFYVGMVAICTPQQKKNTWSLFVSENFQYVPLYSNYRPFVLPRWWHTNKWKKSSWYVLNIFRKQAHPCVFQTGT